MIGFIVVSCLATTISDMHINIQSQSLNVTDHLEKHIEQRIRYLFRHIARDIHSITLLLRTGQNGCRELQSFCQIQVQARGLPIIYAEHQSKDIYDAIGSAVRRAQRNVTRRLNKFNQLLMQMRKLQKQRVETKTLRLPKV